MNDVQDESLLAEQIQGATMCATPMVLYGRENAILEIEKAYERVVRGQSELLLISGPSGVGKTALVSTLQWPVQNSNGYFLVGKFNQYSKSNPYSAFQQALSQFCQQILHEDVPHREHWKSEINGATGGLGQLLVELVPEFERLLGPQPKLSITNPVEARLRFVRLIQSLFQVMSRPEHPVVLFLDDWQWADLASIELLTSLQLGTDLRYFLLIASYRDDENVETCTQLSNLLQSMEFVSRLPLSNLGKEDLRALVKDALRPTIRGIEPLVEELYRRTNGNPFFSRALLNHLLTHGVLRLDLSLNAESGGEWVWNEKELRVFGVPDIVGLFAKDLESLTPENQELLKVASCLGNRFDLDNLAMISGKSREECQKLLSVEPLSNFVQPLTNNRTHSLGASEQFVFRHDRWQQAAYAQMAESMLPRMRLRIARLFTERLSDDQRQDRLFEIVEHYHASSRLIDDPREAVEVIRLSLAASQKAKDFSAYRESLLFLRQIDQLIEDPRFTSYFLEHHYELVLRTAKERAEGEYFEGQPEIANGCIRRALEIAHTNVEKADILAILIVQNTLRARYVEAIAKGREALKLLGILLPQKNFIEARDLEIARLRNHCDSDRFDEKSQREWMSDVEKMAITRLLITMGPACYRSDQQLWSVIVPLVVNLTLEFGPIPQIGYSHPAIGGLLIWVSNDFENARKFGILAEELMQSKHCSPSDQSVYHLMFGSSMRHWFEHMRQSSVDYEAAYQYGLKSGNLQYAAYAFGHNMYCRFFQGIHLDLLTMETRASKAFSKVRRNQWAIQLLQGGLRVFGRLSGQMAIEVASSNHEEYLQNVRSNGNIQVECIYKAMDAVAELLVGSYERAYELSSEVEAILEYVGTQGLLPWPEHRATRLIILTEVLHRQPKHPMRRRIEQEIEEILSQLDVWAKHCPANYEHKKLLAQAEVARLHGDNESARQLYDQSIQAAHDGQFIQWQGIANERAANFWRDLGQMRMEQLYWEEAYRCFDQWGAKAKTCVMEIELREKVATELRETTIPGTCGLTKSTVDLFVEKKLAAIRIRNEITHDAYQRDVALGKAEELAHAAEVLRIDVAERKRAEAMLRRQNDLLEERVQQRTAELKANRDFLADLAERLNLATRAARLGIWDWDIQKNDLRWDERLCQLYGLKEEEHHGTFDEWLGYVHVEDRQRVEQAIQKSVKEHVPFLEEFRIVGKDGKIRDVRAEREVILDSEGRASRMIGVCFDVTARKRHDLLQSLRRDIAEKVARGQSLESLLDMIIRRAEDFHGKAHCAIATIDPTFDGKNRIVALRLPDSLIHQLAVVPLEEKRPNWFWSHPTLLQNDSVEVVEEKGKIRQAALQSGYRACLSVPITSLSSKPLGMLSFFYLKEDDSTDQDLELIEALGEVAAIAIERSIYIEELETAWQAARVASQSKGEFLANMSHEIRTPMTSILGYTELLREKYSNGKDEDEIIETIHRNGQHLLEIINDILDLSKIESGKMEVEPVWFSPLELLNEVKKLMDVRAEGKGIALTVMCPIQCHRKFTPIQLESSKYSSTWLEMPSSSRKMAV